MNQLCVEISEDDRQLTSAGRVVDLAPTARRVKLWLYDQGADTPRFVGEGFFDVAELEKIKSAEPLLQFVAGQADCALSWHGLVPVAEPPPQMGRVMKVLTGFAKMFA